MKRTMLALLVLLASAATAMAQSMKVYQDGQLKAIYYISKSDSVVFSEDFPFPPGGDVDPVDPNPDKAIVPYTHAVDLGLPSGTKWADMNVGAEKPEDYGWYLAWGETEEKSTYNWSTYKYMAAGYSDWNGCSKYQFADGQTSGVWYNGSTFVGDNKTTLDPEDDAAHVNWGGNWRMPTDAELTELRSKCTWSWVTQNGVTGRKVVGPNGNSIFLPAAGYRSGGSLYYAGSNGNYWSSSLRESYSDYAWYVDFNSGDVRRSGYSRYYGRSVRPVCSE